MELLVVVLFIVLLFVILSFKRTVNSNIEKLSHDIWLLKEELAKISRRPLTTESTTPPAPVPPATEIKKEPNYWETSFKPVEERPATVPDKPEPKPAATVLPAITEIKEVVAMPAPKPVQHEPPTPGFFERHPDLEKFIGENLINKIGIAILVLAIGFFVKYAIDNNWIGPVGRVGIGIACGGILVGLAHRLRTNYKGFSSVLAGGGLAIFYFTITLAFHQFHLFDQLTSFIIMIVITAFAVLLSILYNRQELAVIALAGGFATPFMVSNGSGNYQVLFTYLLVLNTGLLVMAYYKSWRLLNILSFLFTVLLFGGWLLSLKTNMPPGTYRNGLMFATAFYLLFFIINIAHNIKENKQFIASDFGILLLNTSVYFAAGLYLITAMHADNYRGLFSAAMGIFNLGASFMLFRKKKADRNILYLLIGITLTFVSLTAPLQLHGNYITLFWSSEAVLLYWLYQRSSIGVIRYSSFIIWVAMVVSLLMDWFQIYFGHSALTIIANKGFITGIYAAAASIALFLLIKKEHAGILDSRLITRNDRVFSVAGLVILFSSGLLEINYQFRYYFPQTGISLQYILCYTYIFVLLYNLLAKKITRLDLPEKYSIALTGCCLILYLICVQDSFYLLRQLLDDKKHLAHFTTHWLGSTTLALLFFILTRHVRRLSANSINNPVISWLLCGWVVIFLSIESYLLNYQWSYKTGSDWHETGNIFQKTILPILWGLCSFAFMWLGMRYKFRTLRIISLALFSITLVKLFVFDIRNIPAGGKIAAFFCLGVLLLVVSFMYQRLKRIIIEDEKKGKHNLFLIILLACFAGSNAQQGFLKRAAIDSVPAAGFYQVNLLPDLAAYLQPDMRDIRIVDNTGKQIPYLLKSDLPVFRENKFTALPVVSVKKETDQQTHIIIENTLHRSLEQLLLIIKNTDAGRMVTLSGSDDKKSWFVIKENIYLDKLTSNNSDRFIKSLVFPLSNYHYFKIIISGKDVIPFNLVQAGVYEEIIQNGKYLPLPSPAMVQKDSTDKYSYISVQLNNSFFIDRFVIDVQGPKFYNRQAEIYSGPSNALVFQEQFIMRSDRENMIQLAAKTNRLLLKIRNNDNPPLQASNIHAFQLNRFLLAYIEKNKSCQLLFEDSTAVAPDYDLEVFKDSISGNASLLQYGAIKKNTPAEIKLPLSGGGNKAFIWMAIGFAITILLLLTYKLTSEIKK